MVTPHLLLLMMLNDASALSDNCAHYNYYTQYTHCTHEHSGLMCSREGKKSFAPVMLKRLKKLGIAKTDPDMLTEAEIHRC